MYILAFETSCDDTSVALMKDEVLISMATRTQLEHSITCGVVPEVAARSHANAIFPCIEEVIDNANITLEQIDYFACTDKPGLLPSLLTGMTVAKTLSLSFGKPIIWVDHIEAHIFANYLERDHSEILFPALVLTVSGGHTELYLWKEGKTLDLLGQTRDDAVGEAFDKVSKMLGLGFPGGAIISLFAQEYRSHHPNTSKRIFPEVLLEADSLDFSFSGIKTAVKREIDRELQKIGFLSEEFKQFIAYEFEETVTDILTKKIIRAYQKYNPKMLLLAGGVSANSTLQSKIRSQADIYAVPFLSPKRSIYSMDNAAMIGMRAFFFIRDSS